MSRIEYLKFQWDENKNTINKKKHDITFEETKTVFYDEMALVIAIVNLILLFVLSPQEKQEEIICFGVFEKHMNHRCQQPF